MEPLIGQIILFGGNFAPRGWAFCDGQLLPISSNSALFSILGTTYGGDGRTTFGLPDLRGRVPMHAGSGPGLTPRAIGQKFGVEDVTLTAAQMPNHTHTLKANPLPANTSTGDGNVLAGSQSYQTGASPLADMNAASVTSVGGSQSHTNVQPSLVTNYIIALQGIFPSRS